MGDVVVFKTKQPPANDDTSSAAVFEITAFEDGKITVWLSYDIQSPGYFNWCFGLLALASEALLEAKRERAK